AIQGISYKSQGVEIGYNVAEAGTYHLQLDASEYSEKLYLFDKELLTTVPMTETGYSFYTSEGSYTERFELLTSPIDVLQAWVEELTVYCADNVLYLNIPITNQKQQVFTLHDLTGKLVLIHMTLQTTTVDLSRLTPGVYLVRQVDEELSYKIIVK
ncbi:MAG: T9SS type A sorting domain-containing protein, partial [Marinoscillum sp.]